MHTDIIWSKRWRKIPYGKVTFLKCVGKNAKKKFIKLAVLREKIKKRKKSQFNRCICLRCFQFFILFWSQLIITVTIALFDIYEIQFDRLNAKLAHKNHFKFLSAIKISIITINLCGAKKHTNKESSFRVHWSPWRLLFLSLFHLSGTEKQIKWITIDK